MSIDAPWNRNAGKFDRPSSSPVPGLAGKRASFEIVDDPAAYHGVESIKPKRPRPRK